jgi:hypothetical protein
LVCLLGGLMLLGGSTHARRGRPSMQAVWQAITTKNQEDKKQKKWPQKVRPFFER